MKAVLLVTAALLALVLVPGCGQPSSAPSAATSTSQKDDHDHGHDGDKHDHKGETAKAGHDHSGWWCAEHGVPEEVCGQCNSKLAAEFQKKGDWCKKHDRPDSQCFLCHPELEAQFAAQYEAKYGNEPPKPQG